MTSISRIKCFGLTIEGLPFDEILVRIQNYSENRPYWIVTANPEILLQAREDESYRKALAEADVRICDSIGLKLCGLLQGKNLKRLTGVELSEKLLHHANQNSWSVAFVGGYGQVARQAYIRQMKTLPTLVGFVEQGGDVRDEGSGDMENNEARRRIAGQKPDMILVALGGTTKQELWIQKYRNEFPTAKVIIGIGGTFNYWAGIVKRAPSWMRAIGLEWLHRLIQEPTRRRRIWNAVVVFPAFFVMDLVRQRH